jgi:hypothetical protein
MIRIHPLIPITLLGVLFASIPRPSLAASIVVREYAGHIDVHGHYPMVHQGRRFDSSIRALGDPWGRLRLEWTTRDSGDTVGSTEITLVRGDSVFVCDSGGKWQLLSGERMIESRMQALAPFPEVVAFYFSGFRFREGKPGEVDGTMAFDPKGFDWQLTKDEQLHITRLVRPRAHPRLGDVDDVISYTYEEESAEEAAKAGEAKSGESKEREEEEEEGRRVVPHELSVTIHERDQDWTFEGEEHFAGRVPMSDSLFNAPRDFAPPGPDDYALTGAVTFTDVAPGLVLANMEDIGSRSMIAEFADSLIVMECAVSSANGERLVDAIKTRWPNKPIRWFLFSHHHPHYLGGLRALVAAGAGVATTPGNVDYVKEITRWPFTRSPDRLAKNPVIPRIRASADRLEFVDKTNHLVALNFGSRWDHTKEALVFWFPEQRVLFETEQGWYTKDGAPAASRRAAGLLALIDDEKWNVDRIAQSWPMQGTDAIVTRARLAELVAARGK